MKVHILGQHNTEPFEITELSTPRIQVLLGRFYIQYRRTPMWKNLPILLTFSESEETAMTQDDFYKGENESEPSHKLRMVSEAVSRVNKTRNLVGGFCATFISETQQGVDFSKRKIGVTFYEFPIHTASVDENLLPTKGSNFHTILGLLVPPSA